MKTLILPGYSLENKVWELEAQKHLPDSILYEWKNWEDPSQAGIDMDYEIKKIVSTSAVNKSRINILAKSIGTWVLVNLIREKRIKINNIVLCGIPLHDLSEGELDQYSSLIEINPKNISIIKNQEDPHGSFHEVKNFVGKINPDIKIVSKDRGDHNYPYFYSFKEFFKD